MTKSQNSFYNFPIRQSTSPESRVSLCLPVCGLPALWLTSSSHNVFLLFPVTLTITWFHPHLISFPWAAGADTWPHCHVQLMLPWDLTTSSCLTRQPWPPQSSLAFFTNLSLLQPHRDLAHCLGAKSPTCRDRRVRILVTKEVLFWHFRCGSANPSDANAKHRGSETEAVGQNLSPGVNKDKREGSPRWGSPYSLRTDLLLGLWKTHA